MIPEKFTELINKEVDGLNSKEESRKLRGYLAKHPEARQLYEDLAKTAAGLKKVEELEPPAYLRQHILNSLGKRRTEEAREGSLWRRIVDAFGGHSMPRYALVFASGLAIGVLLLLIVVPRDLGVRDTSELTGTMALVPELSVFQPADSVAFKAPEASGVIKTYYGSDFVIAEVRLQSDAPVKTEIGFRPENMTFSGFKRLQGDEGSLDIGQNEVELTQSGTNRGFVTFLTRGDSRGPLEIRISRGGRTLYQSVLRTTGAGGIQ
jgi:hypothetical protein